MNIIKEKIDPKLKKCKINLCTNYHLLIINYIVNFKKMQTKNVTFTDFCYSSVKR